MLVLDVELGRAGVSKAAVSRVFTPGASASEAVVRKVRRAAEELGCRPNILSRSLTTGRSRIIGLVVAYLDNAFYSDAAERLTLALQERGHQVLLFMAAPTEAGIDCVTRKILDYQIDGIVLASANISAPVASGCRRHGVPGPITSGRAVRTRGINSEHPPGPAPEGAGC